MSLGQGQLNRMLGVSALLMCILHGSAHASPISFIGSDPGALSFAAMPNSQAAASQFDAAAILLGTETVITFETVAPGAINHTALGGGITLDDAGNIDSVITNGIQCDFNLCGGNTTLLGRTWANAQHGDLIFSFTNPIEGFGAYLTGLQGAFIATQQTIVFDDGSIRTINIPMLDTFGGGAFVGFLDSGASITSLTIHFFGDFTGVDDVRYVQGGATSPGPAQAPEPTSLLLFGTGLLGAGIRRCRTRP